MFTKVITHDTVFHCDDVFAVAMLKYAGFDFSLVRTRNPALLSAAVNDPETLILDVGGQYNPSIYNFDHHQDAALPSAAGMIWQHFKNKICIDVDAQPFFEQFIASIDAIDTNRDNIYAKWNLLPQGFRNTSNIISGFNRDATNASQQDAQFNIAVDFARTIIDNEIYSAYEKSRNEKEYDSRVILKNNVAIFDKFSMIWKAKGDHQFAVMPHATGWQIISADTSVAVVPESVNQCEGFIFRHVSGFMATVADKAVAIEFADTLI